MFLCLINKIMYLTKLFFCEIFKIKPRNGIVLASIKKIKILFKCFSAFVELIFFEFNTFNLWRLFKACKQQEVWLILGRIKLYVYDGNLYYNILQTITTIMAVALSFYKKMQPCNWRNESVLFKLSKLTVMLSKLREGRNEDS